MNNPVLVEQPGKDCLKIIPRKWDLIYVEAKSHLGGMNQFSCKRFVFTKWNIPFCRDLTQVRRLTWVEWLIVLIQRLFSVPLHQDVKLQGKQKLYHSPCLCSWRWLQHPECLRSSNWLSILLILYFNDILLIASSQNESITARDIHWYFSSKIWASW